MGPSQGTKRMVLNSWKEIASYLGRGVRTVQRWEHDLGLPVRRPRGKSRSAVIAMSDELDAWLRNAPLIELNGDGVAFEPKPNMVVNVSVVRESVTHADELRTRCSELRDQHYRIMTALIGNLTEMTKKIAAGRQVFNGRATKMLPRTRHTLQQVDQSGYR